MLKKKSNLTVIKSDEELALTETPIPVSSQANELSGLLTKGYAMLTA